MAKAFKVSRHGQNVHSSPWFLPKATTTHDVPQEPPRGKPRKAPELLTVDEVCEYTRLSESSVRRWARDGRIPGARHLGRRWLFDKAQLLAWLEAGTPEAP
jgi:excisionase family DNA binding protein